VRRRIDRYVQGRIDAAFSGPRGQALADDVMQQARRAALRDYTCFGDPTRVSIGEHTDLNNAVLNTSSGTITIGDYTFFGHGVSILTGTHDVHELERARQLAIPPDGHDIVIGRGVWVATNAIVVGPCRIGDHAVVAAGSVVRSDVPALTVVAGVPARPVASIDVTREVAGQ